MAAAPVDLQALAREVVRVLRADTTATSLLTADQVARRFNVARSWVYAHANELGVIRLGAGPRPRLRFDAAVVAQRLLPAAPPSASPPKGTSSVPLLPIRSARSARSLDP